MKKEKIIKNKKLIKKPKRSTTRLSKLKFEEKILEVKRVTKVVKGGKKMTFRAAVAVGDTKRKVGIGIGRADDVNLAIDKAILNAKKHLINVPLTKKLSIPHFISADFGASSIMIRPASLGTGVIAGGSMRPILELAGIKNALGKQLGSKNILNNAKASISALSLLAQKIELAKYQSLGREKFYKKIMKEFKNA